MEQITLILKQFVYILIRGIYGDNDNLPRMCQYAGCTYVRKWVNHTRVSCAVEFTSLLKFTKVGFKFTLLRGPNCKL